MSKIRKLQNVANGLLGTFVSRNNDIDGYWGLGVLRNELPDGIGSVTLRLVQGDAHPPT